MNALAEHQDRELAALEREPWLVIKVGSWSGWTVHSRHTDFAAAEAEAIKNNGWKDAQFSVLHANQWAALTGAA